MKFCPNCKRDFEDTVSECKWCEIELVSELQDEKAQIKEKLRRELMPTEEELIEEQTEFFNGNGDTEIIFTTFDPIQASKIENAIKEAGIPVLVRPTEEQTEDEEPAEEPAEEMTVEQEPVVEEAEEEAEAVEEPKKGFFARLFSAKKKEKKEKPREEYRFIRGGMLLDIIVPASLTEEAYAVLNKTLGIEGATEDWHYEDAEVITEMLAEDQVGSTDHGDHKELDHEPDGLVHSVDEDRADEL